MKIFSALHYVASYGGCYNDGGKRKTEFFDLDVSDPKFADEAKLLYKTPAQNVPDILKLLERNRNRKLLRISGTVCGFSTSFVSYLREGHQIFAVYPNAQVFFSDIAWTVMKASLSVLDTNS